MLFIFAKCVALRASDLDALVVFMTPRVAFIESNTNSVAGTVYLIPVKLMNPPAGFPLHVI